MPQPIVVWCGGRRLNDCDRDCGRIHRDALKQRLGDGLRDCLKAAWWIRCPVAAVDVDNRVAGSLIILVQRKGRGELDEKYG